MATAKSEKKVVVTIPDMGLTKPQIATLKKSFKNHFTSSIGAAARSDIVVTVVVEIVF